MGSPADKRQHLQPSLQPLPQRIALDLSGLVHVHAATAAGTGVAVGSGIGGGEREESCLCRRAEDPVRCSALRRSEMS